MPIGRSAFPGGQNARNEPNCPKRGTEAVSRRGRVGRGPQGRGTRGKCAKQTQFLGGAKRRASALRKRIYGHLYLQGAWEKQSQTWASWGVCGDDASGRVFVRQRLVARCRSGNKANFGRATWHGHPPPARGQALPVTLDHRQDADATVRPDGGKCAKQTQFPAEQKEGQRLGGKGVMVNSTFDRPRQNKANLRGLGRRPWGSSLAPPPAAFDPPCVYHPTGYD